MAVGLVLTHRASGVLNLAHAAMGMYVAVAFYELRATGELILPILGLPARLPIVRAPTVATALAVCMVLAAVLGGVIYLAIIRPLRHAPPLSALVASLGLLVYLMEIARLRIGSQGATGLAIDGILPDGLVKIGGALVGTDRLWLAGITLGSALLLAGLYRFTRFGRETRALADNERGAVLLGISPIWVGAVNWVLASVVAGLLMVLAAPATRLDVGASSLLVVPALAAALVAHLRSFVGAALAGLGIGMVQSELMNVQVEWAWLPDVGIQQGVPLLVILAVLAFWGDVLPQRGVVLSPRLPRSAGVDVGAWRPMALLAAAGIAVMVLDSEWRLAVAISACVAVIALSVVVVTGLVGQVSFAPYAFAGIAAFTVIRLDYVPFPIAPLVGGIVAVAVGVVVGLLAVRVRGSQLAVATLAGSIAIEELIFRWSWFSGGDLGARMPRPSLFGLDLGIGAVGSAYPRRAFVVTTLVVLALCLLMTLGISRGVVGRRWRAVRDNERAASAAGIDVAGVKLTAFAVSALLAGIGGVLLGYQRQIVTGSSFALFDSLMVVAVVYLAGIATPAGALLAGALASGGVLTVALARMGDSGAANQLAVSGLLLMVVVVWLPTGVFGSVAHVGRAVRGRSRWPSGPTRSGTFVG